MMRHSLFALTLTHLLFIHNTAYAAELPDTVTMPLDSAIATGNATVIEATASHLMRQHPEQDDAIQTYVSNKQAEVAGAEAEEVAELAPAAGKKKEEIEGWSGEVELGIEHASGNSEYENYFAAAEAIREDKQWKHQANLKARNNAENDVRTAEEYRAEWQSNYKLSDIDYVFGNAEYVKDRFSGYNYRFAETVGYGRTLLEGETYSLVGEAGLGARHTDTDIGGTEHEFIQKVKGIFDWEITDSLHFSEELETTFGSETTITESETQVTSALTSALDLRFRLNIEHISDVPAGNKKTDTTTGLNLVYGF